MVGRNCVLPRLQSAAVAVAVILLTLGAWWWTSLPAEAPVASSIETGQSPDSPPATTAGLVVHVAGEVRRPGVVRVADGARIVDAIEAAGGATPRAVLAGVNLAAQVTDGAQIVVPSRDASTSVRAAGGDDGLVPINTADGAELENLPGVGPVLAGRIVGHRDEHGPFATVEDLLDVPGIGESILARLRPHVRIP